MKAFTYTKYGPVENNFKLSEVEKPVPKKNQVLIKVQATSINRPDWYRLVGWPQVVRLSSGIFKPRKSSSVLGSDVSGVIEAAGSEVTRFKKGDEVYGEISVGSFAEYAVAKPKHLAIRPKNMSYVESAAIPLTGITALQAVVKLGNVHKGEQVLINGASGGVGHFAVQIAKSLGANVTAVCGTDAVAIVKKLGADTVIDYQKNENIPESKFDVVIDIVGNLSIEDHKKCRVAGGRGVLVGFASFKQHRPFILKGKRNSIKLLMAEPNTKDLDYLRELVEAKKLKPVVAREFEFEELPAAMELFMTGHTNGKIAVRVAAK